MAANPTVTATRPAIRIIGTAVIAMILLAGLELGARAVLAAKEALRDVPAVARWGNRSIDLDPYEMPSPDHLGHWTLVPGYGADAAAIVADKATRGRAEGAAAIAKAGLSARLMINQDGFKGAPLDNPRTRPRVLVLGDSVTFGYPDVDYVRAMEAALARNGLAVECVNGGAEGYSVRNHLLRLPDYAKVAPDIVLLLVGWNDLFSIDRAWFHWWGRSAALRLGEQSLRFLARLTTTAHDRALAQRQKPKIPDAAAPEIARFATLRPAMLADIERLGDTLAAQGARVVVVTLPGLYVSGETPSARALKIGHLPEYTDNPLAFAALTEAANAGLVTLAARKGWELADLAQWSREGLSPRDSLFVDSVHLTAEGYRRIGDMLAGRVAPLINGGSGASR